MSFRPAGDSSDELSDSDYELMDHHVNQISKVEVQLTDEQKYEKLLHDLYTCLNRGNVDESLNLIAKHNLDVDVKLEDDWTPLLLAAANGCTVLTKTFIEKGANVNQSRDTITVLMHGCSISKWSTNFVNAAEITKYLVSKGAEVNIEDKKRMTAFLHAASSGNLEVIQFLINICDPNVVDNQHWNALFYAVDGNHIELATFLVDAGVKSNVTDIHGNLPFDYAQRLGHTAIIEVLPEKWLQENSYDSYLCETYDYVTELENPRFMRDVNVMLIGMNSGRLMETFATSDMNLYKFLTLNKEKLHAMNITKPYQVNRILGGIYRFHKAAFKYKSVPRVKRNDLFTTYDIGFTLFCAIRHLITIQASLDYVTENATDWHDKALEQVDQIQHAIRKAIDVTEILHNKCLKFERENVKVDEITYPLKKKTSRCVYVVPIVTALGLLLFFKYKC